MCSCGCVGYNSRLRKMHNQCFYLESVLHKTTKCYYGFKTNNLRAHPPISLRAFSLRSFGPVRYSKRDHLLQDRPRGWKPSDSRGAMNTERMGGGDTCRLAFWLLLHKDVCVYQRARVPPLRFQHKNGLQYRLFPPPWRLWHWWGVQSAENLKKHRQEFLAPCTRGYWEASQRELLWIWCRIVAKSRHLAGSALGQQAEFSQRSHQGHSNILVSILSLIFGDALAFFPPTFHINATVDAKQHFIVALIINDESSFTADLIIFLFHIA